MKNKQLKFQDLGLLDYKVAWDYQEELFKSVVDIKLKNRNENLELPTPNYLLFCQHPHVFTLGKSGSLDHLLVQEDELVLKQASFYKINRGGDITYHGPGQLVAYPILDLDNFFTDIHKYVRFLEEAVIRTCADFGVSATRIEGLTGVWITEGMPRKICAIGVKSSRWVTMHGLALNVNTDLSYFGNIVPCGIDDKAVTSLQMEIGHEVSMLEVAEKLKLHFGELFEVEWN
ncbi:lipoyl(octanoyl) transferase LipB [Leadbetterella byssophila]|uniref:Octanoyltransferase n=1 Tax=Leadbetterella byssophila (strain DSM 17132 / JCM 16389 / KACC 11308 / NBRC 106382 / 4M15) TaxID=649349 RepID=E4RUK5_LEAB4|nr:lipoyl(octanoyl) transferase LipB [Leadbetterella byssophila]ADQ18741.1 lipoate-protein ligase B [Leadbetterella byssophila DSM 17132]